MKAGTAYPTKIPAGDSFWKLIQPGGVSAHYKLFWCTADEGMAALREMFSDGKADDLNFVLFSTSGVHGSYRTIEEAEERLGFPENEVTFQIIHPRTVCIRYGNCIPENSDDIAFLKRLRQTSWEAIQTIGKHHE